MVWRSTIILSLMSDGEASYIIVHSHFILDIWGGTIYFCYSGPRPLDGGGAMFEDIKQHISEVVEIAQLCPENLQEKCFEIILLSFLQNRGMKLTPEEGIAQIPPRQTVEVGLTEVEEIRRQEDIADKDLHVKARRFLKDNKLNVEHLNQLYYKENGDFKPLYDDLGTTKTAESQLRLALLKALENGMINGEFEFKGESVREKCKEYKCYDMNNYTSNFRSRSSLFDGFEKYEGGTSIKLSREGKSKLAEIIKELSGSK